MAKDIEVLMIRGLPPLSAKMAAIDEGPKFLRGPGVSSSLPKCVLARGLYGPAQYGRPVSDESLNKREQHVNSD